MIPLVVGIGKGSKGKDSPLLASQDLGRDRPYQSPRHHPVSLRVVRWRRSSSGRRTWNTRQLQLKHKKKRTPPVGRRGEERRPDHHHHHSTPITETERALPTMAAALESGWQVRPLLLTLQHHRSLPLMHVNGMSRAGPDRQLHRVPARHRLHLPDPRGRLLPLRPPLPPLRALRALRQVQDSGTFADV